MKCKKVLACILTIIMMLVIQIQPETLYNKLNLGNAAKSYTETTIDNIKYHIYSEYAEMFECDKNVEGSIIIPSNVNGIPITSIYHYSFHGCSKLKSVSLPDGIMTIGNHAFSECSELESINIPNSVTDIGNWAFYLCRNLSSIKVPDNAVNIGCQAFDKTAWLLEKQKENPLVIINNILIDGSTCKGNVIVPDSVTSIGSRAFWECSGLTSISLPNSVTSIGDDAFRKCVKMTSIILPDSITNIGAGAFSNCSVLSSIALPEGLLTINKNTFSNCSMLSSITVPNSVTSIGFGAFMLCSELTSIIIPNVESLDENVFEYCKKLTIYGKKGSCVDNYAYKYGIPFEDISNLTSTTTMTTTTTTTTTQKPTTTTTTSTTTSNTSITTTSFYIEKTSISLINGEQYEIPINMNDISFKSTNTNVAVVSPNGIVTAIDIGEAIINIIDKDYNVVQIKVSVQPGNSVPSGNELGDVNNDGQINAVDASNILAYYAYLSTTKEDILSLKEYMKK